MTNFIARFAIAILAPLAILHPAPAQCSPVPPRWAVTSPVEERMGHISVMSYGKGSPVILIPGLSSPRAVWNGVLPELIKTHRVILVQINGFGGDDPGANLKPGILDGVVADLDAYIAKEKLNGAPMIGHSLGGLVALMLAKAHPGDAGKLMIVDSLPWYGMLFGPTATVAAVEPQAKAMRDGLAANYGKPDTGGAAAIAAKLALKPDSQAKVTAWVKASDARVGAQAMYEDLTTDLRGDLAGIATPITLVYPTSAALPAAVAGPFYKGAYASAPHVTFVEVSDSAHFVMLDQPEVFLKAVLAFVG